MTIGPETMGPVPSFISFLVLFPVVALLHFHLHIFEFLFTHTSLCKWATPTIDLVLISHQRNTNIHILISLYSFISFCVTLL